MILAAIAEARARCSALRRLRGRRDLGTHGRALALRPEGEDLTATDLITSPAMR